MMQEAMNWSIIKSIAVRRSRTEMALTMDALAGAVGAPNANDR